MAKKSHHDDGKSEMHDSNGHRRHWIQATHMKKGALHRELGVPEGQKIPAAKMEEALHSKNPEEKKRAEFAEKLESFHKK